MDKHQINKKLEAIQKQLDIIQKHQIEDSDVKEHNVDSICTTIGLIAFMVMLCCLFISFL